MTSSCRVTTSRSVATLFLPFRLSLIAVASAISFFETVYILSLVVPSVTVANRFLPDSVSSKIATWAMYFLWSVSVSSAAKEMSSSVWATLSSSSGTTVAALSAFFFFASSLATAALAAFSLSASSLSASFLAAAALAAFSLSAATLAAASSASFLAASFSSATTALAAAVSSLALLILRLTTGGVTSATCSSTFPLGVLSAAPRLFATLVPSATTEVPPLGAGGCTNTPARFASGSVTSC